MYATFVRYSSDNHFLYSKGMVTAADQYTAFVAFQNDLAFKQQLASIPRPCSKIQTGASATVQQWWRFAIRCVLTAIAHSRGKSTDADGTSTSVLHSWDWINGGKVRL